MQDARGPLFLLVLPLANKARRVEQIILAAPVYIQCTRDTNDSVSRGKRDAVLGFSHSVVFPVLAGLVTRRAASCPIKMHRTTQTPFRPRTADRPALTPLIFMPLFSKDCLKLWLSCFIDAWNRVSRRGEFTFHYSSEYIRFVKNILYEWSSPSKFLESTWIVFISRSTSFRETFDAIALRFACTRYYLQLVRNSTTGSSYLPARCSILSVIVGYFA